jgi:hypothetical protein
VAGRIKRAWTQLLTPGNPEVIAVPPKPIEVDADRSSHWSTVRKAHLKLCPTCAVCGGTHDLDVHHCVPFHLEPDLELVEANLITLCTPHHFLVGHLMDWKAYNPRVKSDAKWLLNKIRHRPYVLLAG